MNTVACADVNEREASGASTIASTVQQMAVSFGVAAASFAANLFIPDRLHATAPQMIHGIHLALWALGALTIVSTVVFTELKTRDANAVTRANAELPTG